MSEFSPGLRRRPVTQPTPEQQIGREIAEFRRTLGWSQAKLAEQMKARPGDRYVNWRQGMIDKTERGLRPLRLNEIVDIAAVLGVGPDLLLAPVLGDLDPEVLDAQIAQIQISYQTADHVFHVAWDKLHEIAANQASAQVELDHMSAQVNYFAATLAALQRARRSRQADPQSQERG
jgi:transcriptional regulator with XRE-family HTH domain